MKFLLVLCLSFACSGFVLCEPAGEKKRAAQGWSYTVDRPGVGWEAAGFDDSAWKQGPGGFGKTRKPVHIGTPWRSGDIWLRREFDLKKIPKTPVLEIFHDEDAYVYLNGTLVRTLLGHVNDYRRVKLEAKHAALLKKGRNLIAVHGSQSSGGQYIDARILQSDP